jgi:hypothetical protein
MDASKLAAMRAGFGEGVLQTSSAERELQEQKLREVLGLLLSAGYFRARLPNVPDFDKVSRWLCEVCVF